MGNKINFPIVAIINVLDIAKNWWYNDRLSNCLINKFNPFFDLFLRRNPSEILNQVNRNEFAIFFTFLYVLSRFYRLARE